MLTNAEEIVILKDKQKKKQKEKKRKKNGSINKRKEKKIRDKHNKRSSTTSRQYKSSQSISTATAMPKETIGGVSDDCTGDDCEYECSEFLGSY